MIEPQVEYGSYRIEPRPMQLQATGEWTLWGHISRDIDGGRRVQMFSAKNTFPTRDLAMAGIVRLGRDIIDGKALGDHALRF